MMIKKTVFQLSLLSTCAALACSAQAQTDAPDSAASAPRIERRIELVERSQIEAHAQASAEQALAHARVVMAGDENMAFARFELGNERLVKGAPYCADAVHESVQPLADGNRIVRSSSTKLCRDGEGRTRQETEREGKRNVFLRDPVSKESWMLDVQQKTARQIGGPLVAPDNAAWREYGERMREWAQKMKEQVRVRVTKDGSVPPIPPVPAAPPAPAAMPAPPAPVVITSENVSKDEQGRERREVRVQVMRVDGGGAGLGALHGMPPLSGLPGINTPLPPQAVTLRALHMAPRGPGVSTSLGAKEIDGLKVNGERTSWTIEAGKLGNEKPIVITRDVWTSPDLMVTVATRDFDPRSGEVNYKLQNLKRGEPDAALMAVPADYAKTARPAPRAAAPARKASEATKKG